MTRVAILNSHQSKTPVGHDRWVQSTLVAVEYAVQQGWGIVTSIGLNTWELVTWAAARRRGPIDMVIPDCDEEEKTQRTVAGDFGLHLDLVRWHVLNRQPNQRAPKAWWTGRDDFICELADVLLPVSLRPGGRIEALISQSASRKTIDDRFRVPYDPQPHHERLPIDPDRINPALHAWGDGFLIHWTRACHGPWPGECAADFYEDLVRSGESYCRSALPTLQRILGERTLRASGWRIGDKQPVVAFTELSPVESLPLMSWRSRWSRWSFEPYGIATHRDWAMAHGVRPVRYVTDEEWRALRSDEKPFCHRRGHRADIWPAEREWRHSSDFCFGDTPHDAVRLIVRRESEAVILRGSADHPVYAFAC